MSSSFPDNLTTALDIFKKIAVSLLSLILSIILLILMIGYERKRPVIVQPFQISPGVVAQGYSGELMAALFVQKIRNIQDSGRSLYHKNKIVIPSSDDKMGEFDVALSNSIFGDVNSILGFFMNMHNQTATGELAEIDSKLVCVFTLNGLQLKIPGCTTIDSLLEQTAEATMAKIDPYTLAAYCLNKGDDMQCLQIAQRLLNDDDPSNDGLANHLRGLVYLHQKDTLKAKAAFLGALKEIKTPWVTYTNLGVIYDHYDSTGKAREMYLKSISIQPDAFSAYLNFGSQLYKQYLHSNDTLKLDSAITLYKEAAERDKDDISPYLRLLPALYEKHDTVAADSIKTKVLEMAADDITVYAHVGGILISEHDTVGANLTFDEADRLCHGDTILIKQVEFFRQYSAKRAKAVIVKYGLSVPQSDKPKSKR